jgi:hypothetical protein
LGTSTTAREEESRVQVALTAEEGEGPMVAVHVRGMPGSMKLCPWTVSTPPTRGDEGEADTATGTREMKMAPESTWRECPVSDDVCTVMPLSEPSVAAPRVTPLRVMMKGEEAGSDAALSVNTRDVLVVGLNLKLSAAYRVFDAATKGWIPGKKNACG